MLKLFFFFSSFFLKFYGGARERGKAKTQPRHCYLQSRPGWPARKVASKESEASAAAGKKWRRGELRGWQVGRRCLVSTFPSSVWPPRSSSEHGPPLMDQTVVLCTLAAFLLYYNTLHADFAYDDRWGARKTQTIFIIHLESKIVGLFICCCSSFFCFFFHLIYFDWPCQNI